MPLRISLFYLFSGAFLLLCTINLQGALTPLILSFFLAYLLFPVIHWLESRQIGRNTATAVVLLIVVTLGLLFLMKAVPQLILQGQDLFARFPDLLANLIARVQAVANHYGFPLNINKEQTIDLFRQSLSGMGLQQLMNITNLLANAFSGVVHSVLFIMNFFLFPIFFFFIINRYEGITQEFWSLIPAQHHKTVRTFSTKTEAVLSGYIRGQLMVALILAMMYTSGFLLIDLPFALFVGLMTGLLSIIPYVGTAIGLVTSLALVLANYTGMTAVIALFAVFTVIQCLESFVITPRVVGDKVGIGTLETMLALIIGGNLFGFIGMLAAIPVAGILRLVYLDSKTLCVNQKTAD